MSEYRNMFDYKPSRFGQNQSENDVFKSSDPLYDASNYKDEYNLKSIGKFLMIIGLIVGVIILLTQGITQKDYKGVFDFNLTAIVISLCPIVSSVAIYFLFNVISNVSISLKILSNKK